MLPAPMMSGAALQDSLLLLPERFDRARHFAHGTVPLPPQAPWPRQSPVAAGGDQLMLPVPELDIFQMPKKHAVGGLDPNKLSHRAELEFRRLEATDPGQRADHRRRTTARTGAGALIFPSPRRVGQAKRAHQNISTRRPSRVAVGPAQERLGPPYGLCALQRFTTRRMG